MIDGPGAHHRLIYPSYLGCGQSDGTSVLEQRLELTLLGLQIAVSTNVLAANVDVGDGPLAVNVGKGGLHVASVVYLWLASARIHVFLSQKYKGEGDTYQSRPTRLHKRLRRCP